tara:strand:+ start:1014 stop:2267 length:1254 start_codon:yes stop_codon:yes gene_type:complete
LKFKTKKFIYSSILGISSLLITPNRVYSNPSGYFEERKECLENPDFITPSSKEFKYCIKENGIIKKYDEFDNLVDIDIKLDELIEEKIKKETKKSNKIKVVRSPNKELIEYKIDDEELFKYSCEAKKERGNLTCKNKSKKELIGIRPNGFYLKKGLREIENKRWDKSTKFFDKEIEYNNNQEAYAYRAFSKFKLEDYLGSIKDLEDALKIDKSDIFSLSLRSRANFKLKNYQEVIFDLNKLITLIEFKSNKEITELFNREINPVANNYFYLRGLAKSELGDSNGAIKDFNLEIINNPLNGDAYFQKGLEKYWVERDEACEDLIKGVSLGAIDTSSEFLEDTKESNSFLDELFTGSDNKSLIDACKSSSTKKAESIKQNYESEKLNIDIKNLIKKYYFLIPIPLLILGYTIVKYRSKD